MTGFLLRDIMRGYSKSLLNRLPPSASHQADKNLKQVTKKRKKMTGNTSNQVDKNAAQVPKKRKKKTGEKSPQAAKNFSPGKKKQEKKTGESSPRQAEDPKKQKRIKQVKSSATNILADKDRPKEVGEIVPPTNKSRKRKLEFVAKSDVCSTSKPTKIKKPNHLSDTSASDTNKEKTDKAVISPAQLRRKINEELKRKSIIGRPTLVHKRKKMIGVSKMDPKQDVSSIAPVSDTLPLKLKEMSKILCPMKLTIKLTDHACKSTTQTLLSPLNAKSRNAVARRAKPLPKAKPRKSAAAKPVPKSSKERTVSVPVIVLSHNAVALSARPSVPKAKPRKSVAAKPVSTTLKDATVSVPMVVLPQLDITPPESLIDVSSTTPMTRTPPRGTSLVPSVERMPVGLIIKLENISPTGSCDGDVHQAVPKIMVPLVKRMLSLSAPKTLDPAISVESSACASVSVSQENNSTRPIDARKRSRVHSLPPSIVRSNVAPGAVPSVTANAREIIASDRKSSHAQKSLAGASPRKRLTLMPPRKTLASEAAVNSFSPMCSKPGVVRKTLDCGRRSGLLESTSVSSTLAPVTEVITTSPTTSPAFKILLNGRNDSLQGKQLQNLKASSSKSTHAQKSKATASSRTRTTQKSPRTIRAAERAVNRFSPTMFSKRRVVRKTLDCGKRSGEPEATSVSSTLAPVTEVIAVIGNPPPGLEKLLNVFNTNDTLRAKKVRDLNAPSSSQTPSSANNESHEDGSTGPTASKEPGSIQNDVEPQQETDSVCVGGKVATKGLRGCLRPSAVQSLPRETSRVVTEKAVKHARMQIDGDLGKEGQNNKKTVVFKRRPITRTNQVPKKNPKGLTALESLASNGNNNIETEVDEVTKNSNGVIIRNLLGSVLGKYKKKRKKSSQAGIANCCWLCGDWKVKLRMHLRSKHAEAFVRRKERALSTKAKNRLVKKRTKQCYDTAIMLRRVQRYPFSKSVLRQRYDQAEWETCEESVLKSTEALGFKVMSGEGAWRWKAIAGRKYGNYDFFVED